MIPMEDENATQTPEQTPDAQRVHPARLVVFAVMSVGFLAWVLFGSVEARVWVAGRLTFVDRRISDMWQYFGANLPSLPAPGLVSIVFWLSISFIIVGTIAGLWLFLGTPDDDPHRESLESIHSAHLKHESE